MSLLRPTTSALRTSLRTARAAPSSATRALSSTPARRAGASHDDHYDAPTGWLWGVKPGEKAEKEGWEPYFFWGFCGTWALAVVAYAFKPDTSIQTWALEEARRRLEVEGILAEPEDKS